MNRLHLFEIEDQAWLPASIRDAATDYLQFAIALGKPYAPIRLRLDAALKMTGARTVVDLCSGGGGPWPTMIHEFPELEAVHLTDKYPNTSAMLRIQSDGVERMCFYGAPVDATAVAPGLKGFRTLFSSFHHFPPEAARAMLADAARKGEGIAVFEATQRSAPAVLSMFLAVLLVLFCTPVIRPFRLSRLLWTYLLPVVPVIVLFDGIVSCLRTYSPKELRALVASLPTPSAEYHWEIGEERQQKSPLPVTYLIGYPAATPARSAGDQA